jgi:hypothetical protein
VGEAFLQKSAKMAKAVVTVIDLDSGDEPEELWLPRKRNSPEDQMNVFLNSKGETSPAGQESKKRCGLLRTLYIDGQRCYEGKGGNGSCSFAHALVRTAAELLLFLQERMKDHRHPVEII